MIPFDPNAIACCVATGCCCVGGVCAYRHRKRIPHPSEFKWIGKCCLVCGCHNHPKFDLLIEVHEAQNVPAGAKCIFEMVAGRFDAQTQAADEKKGRCEIHERLSLHVRQCDAFLDVNCHKKGVLTNDSLGSISINVKQELLEAGFPKRHWYTLQNQGHNTVKVQISFHKLDTENVQLGKLEMSPLVQQAVLQAQYEAEARGEPFNLDLMAMTDLEKLRFYSTVLEGPLKLMSAFGGSWKDLHVKAVEKRNGKWEWQYWDSRDDCVAGKKKVGSYPFLAISVVLADTSNRHCFYMKFHDANGAHDLVFKRVDRDRNLWSDGLYEFIERLREYLEKNPSTAEVESFLKKRGKKEKKSKKKASTSHHHGEKSPRSPRGSKGNLTDRSNSGERDSETQPLLDAVRRMPSPRDAVKMPRRPSTTTLASKMTGGVMYSEDELEEEDDP